MTFLFIKQEYFEGLLQIYPIRLLIYIYIYIYTYISEENFTPKSLVDEKGKNRTRVFRTF